MSNTTIVTFTGKQFDFLNPRPEDICIEDIAHALANTCRYSGHTRKFYSVAEHSVRMSYMTIGDPLVNLLHDADEAYIGDIPKPQKSNLGWKHRGDFLLYKDVESTIMMSICAALKLPSNITCKLVGGDAETKKADTIMMTTEIRDTMPPSEAFEVWTGEIELLPETIRPWPPEFAENEFLCRYKELTR